jgi:hypothetical protein
MVRRVVARTTTAMAAAAMQREAVRRTVIAISIRAVGPLAALAVLLGLLLRLATGDEGRQALDVYLGLLLVVLRARLILRLRLMLRLTMLRLILLRLELLWLELLRLMVLLFARIEGLLLAWRKRLAGHGRLVIVAVIVAIVRHIAAQVTRLLLEIGRGLTQLLLRGGDQAKVMFGVLIVMLGCDHIAGTLRVAGELKIFFGDVRRRTPDLYVLPVGLVDARQRILMMATLTVASTHAFVLSVSHGYLFHQPRILRRRPCGRFSAPKFTAPNAVAPGLIQDLGHRQSCRPKSLPA